MSGEESSSGFLDLEGVEDVEEYIWANEGEGSLPWDRFSHVFDLAQNGNQEFRQNSLASFGQSINYYSRANTIKPNDPVILGNRCAAYIRISQFLKLRNPSDSEYRALNGLDPTIHAELALKDAEKLLSLQGTSVRPYTLKARTLLLLEKYQMARDTVISGLQVDPFSNPLRAILQYLERNLPRVVERQGHGRPERNDDFDCTLCLKLLYEPITTPCGHSFCRSCLFQSMDRGNKCPLCRRVLFMSPRTSAVSVTLNNIIQKNFPEEYAERKAEHESLTYLGVDLVPLFVMDVVIPCQKYHLHIFEPQYRLMLAAMRRGVMAAACSGQPRAVVGGGEGQRWVVVSGGGRQRLAVRWGETASGGRQQQVRRIMEGNHRMGMVAIDSSTGSIADFACEVEITECEPLPDGRFFIEVEGRRRFRIIRSWDQDGYRVAEVEWVQDVHPPQENRERVDLLELTTNAAERALSWLTGAKQASRQDRSKYEKLLSLERMMPSPQDPEGFSFWLATLTNRRPQEKLYLLRIRDTRERINRGLIYLRDEEQGCRVQK